MANMKQVTRSRNVPKDAKSPAQAKNIDIIFEKMCRLNRHIIIMVARSENLGALFNGDRVGGTKKKYSNYDF